MNEREREIAESACDTPGCDACAHYIRTGEAAYRPVSRKAYLDGLRASYPNGIPARILPTWAEDGQ